MADTVIKLVDKAPKDKLGLLALLEELTKQAKAGEFDEMLVVCFRSDGDFFTHGTGTKSYLHMVGALEFLKADVINSNKPQ